MKEIVYYYRDYYRDCLLLRGGGPLFPKGLAKALSLDTQPLLPSCGTVVELWSHLLRYHSRLVVTPVEVVVWSHLLSSHLFW